MRAHPPQTGFPTRSVPETRSTLESHGDSAAKPNGCEARATLGLRPAHTTPRWVADRVGCGHRSGESPTQPTVGLARLPYITLGWPSCLLPTQGFEAQSHWDRDPSAAHACVILRRGYKAAQRKASSDRFAINPRLSAAFSSPPERDPAYPHPDSITPEDPSLPGELSTRIRLECRFRVRSRRVRFRPLRGP